MRIVFMGTPEFAAASLRRLYEEGRQVVGVVTQPDRPRGRGMRDAPSPVKSLAEERGTPVLQPQSLKGDTAAEIAELRPDLIAVVAYGRILPAEVLLLPRLGCVNIHASLLPKYRGAAPIQWAILNGEKTTGVTSMYMAEELDAGDIIMSRQTEIGEEETAGELSARLAALGAELLSETLDAIDSGTAPRIRQDHRLATYAPPITKELSPIDWSRTARQILCHIRGLDPWPVATARLGGVTFKVFKARATDKKAPAPPGSVVQTGREGIEVACADGTVVITEIQAPGGRRMSAADYLRGHKLCL